MCPLDTQVNALALRCASCLTAQAAMALQPNLVIEMCGYCCYSVGPQVWSCRSRGCWVATVALTSARTEVGSGGVNSCFCMLE